MVRAADLLHRVLDRAHEELHALVTRTLPGQDYEDRRAEITKYVHYTRRALVQLLVLLEWLSGQTDAMHRVTDGAAFLQSEAQQVRVILDRLFYTHRDLFRKQVASRPYDLATAIDVLALGSTFARFPRELDLSRSTALDKDGFSDLELNHAIHSSLIIREQVPAQYAYARVAEGMLHLVDSDNFALCLMLESPDPLSPWRLLDIQLLFPPQGGYDGRGNAFHALKPDLRQMKQLFALVMPLLEKDPEPLLKTYKLCRSFCNALMLEMLALQAKELTKGHWQGHLQVDDSAVGQLEMIFWKGVCLRAGRVGNQESMTGADPAATEESEVGMDAAAGKRACILRVWLDEEDGMRPLRATCSYHPACEGSTGKAVKEVTSHLSIKGPHVSASSLLRQAFRFLVPRRLQVVHDLLEQDAVLQSLAQRGNMQTAHLGSSLQLEVWGSQVVLDVDRKSGRFIVGAPSSSGAHPSAGLADLLGEWQASLGECSTAASFSFALRLFHGIVRHLFLRHLEVLASTHYDLACDRRWYKLQPSNLKGTEADEDQSSMALRAKASTYFVLNARSGLLKDENGLGVSALGERWGFLEVEASDVGLGGPVLCAYMVMASLARRTARVPVPQSRHLLDVPAINGTAHEVWLGQVLGRARETMQVRLVLDAVTTALGLSSATEGCFQGILTGKRVVLEVGKTQLTKSIEEGRLTSVSVERSSENEWTWNVGLPALELPGLPPRRDDTSFARQDGTSRLACRCGGVLEVILSGRWDPLGQALQLAEVVATVARLSRLAASFPSYARPGFVLADREGNSALPIHELPFLHTSGIAGALCHSAFEGPRSSEYSQGGLGGRFFLSFADPALNQVRGAWGLVEDDFSRSHNLGELLERVEAWASPLLTLAGTLRDRFANHKFNLVPWSRDSLAVTCAGGGTEGLLLLTVGTPGPNHGQSGVVRLTCHDTGAAVGGDGATQREWGRLEFDAKVVVEGVRSCFRLSPL